MTDVLEAASPAAVAPQVASAPPKPIPKWMHNDRLVTLAITLFTWISLTGYATPFVDDSWRFTLWAARFNNVDWGSDLAFTYGPLAFLDGGPMHSRPAALGVLLVRLLMVFAFCTLVLNITHAIGMRRKRAILLTLGMVVFMVPGERLSELVVTLAGVWVVQLLLTRGHLSALERAGSGALAGFWIAVKPSAGLLVVAVVVVASLVSDQTVPAPRTQRWLKGLVQSGASGLLAGLVFAVTWAAAGQHLSSIPGFFSGWLDVSNGFAQGMVSRDNLLLSEVLLLGIGCGLMFALVQRWFAQRIASNAALVVVVGGLIFWARQIGMARANGPHLRDAAVVMTLLALVCLPHVGKRAGSIMFAVALVQVSALSFHVGLPLQVGPWNVAQDLLAFASSDSVPDRRQVLAQRYGVPQSIQTEIGGSTVHISPVDTNVPFAYPEMGFWMLPTVQHYVSYSEVLEERNAAALSGHEGPEFVLHKPSSKVDKHNRAWESPLLIHTIWCSFDQVDSGNGWTLLQSTGQSTCSSVRQLGPAMPLVSSEIAIPGDARECDGAVTFRIDNAERTTVDRLTQLVVRLPNSTVRIGADEWPLFAATAGQPHIIAAPEADLGWLGEPTPAPADLDPSLEVGGLAGYFGPSTTPSIVFQCWQKDVG